MKFIRLCTVDNSFEAQFIQEDLAQAGIACMVTNENFTTLMPHLNGIMGAGIQILVHKDEFERGAEVLEKRRIRNVSTCPECNSTNIRFGLGTARRAKKLFALVMSVLSVTPIPHIKQTYYCRDCQKEFNLK